jgi:hypothetical protein
LIATALSGAVIANPPQALLPAFHSAVMVTAAAAFLSGLTAYLTLTGKED